jgi:hypothetical protein
VTELYDKMLAAQQLIDQVHQALHGYEGITPVAVPALFDEFVVTQSILDRLAIKVKKMEEAVQYER